MIISIYSSSHKNMSSLNQQNAPLNKLELREFNKWLGTLSIVKNAGSQQPATNITNIKNIEDEVVKKQTDANSTEHILLSKKPSNKDIKEQSKPGIPLDKDTQPQIMKLFKDIVKEGVSIVHMNTKSVNKVLTNIISGNQDTDIAKFLQSWMRAEYTHPFHAMIVIEKTEQEKTIEDFMKNGLAPKSSSDPNIQAKRRMIPVDIMIRGTIEAASEIVAYIFFKGSCYSLACNIQKHNLKSIDIITIKKILAELTQQEIEAMIQDRVSHSKRNPYGVLSQLQEQLELLKSNLNEINSNLNKEENKQKIKTYEQQIKSTEAQIAQSQQWANDVEKMCNQLYKKILPKETYISELCDTLCPSADPMQALKVITTYILSCTHNCLMLPSYIEYIEDDNKQKQDISKKENQQQNDTMDIIVLPVNYTCQCPNKNDKHLKSCHIAPKLAQYKTYYSKHHEGVISIKCSIITSLVPLADGGDQITGYMSRTNMRSGTIYNTNNFNNKTITVKDRNSFIKTTMSLNDISSIKKYKTQLNGQDDKFYAFLSEQSNPIDEQQRNTLSYAVLKEKFYDSIVRIDNSNAKICLYALDDFLTDWINQDKLYEDGIKKLQSIINTKPQHKGSCSESIFYLRLNHKINNRFLSSVSSNIANQFHFYQNYLSYILADKLKLNHEIYNMTSLLSQEQTIAQTIAKDLVESLTQQISKLQNTFKHLDHLDKNIITSEDMRNQIKRYFTDEDKALINTKMNWQDIANLTHNNINAMFLFIYEIFGLVIDLQLDITTPDNDDHNKLDLLNQIRNFRLTLMELTLFLDVYLKAQSAISVHEVMFLYIQHKQNANSTMFNNLLRCAVCYTQHHCKALKQHNTDVVSNDISLLLTTTMLNMYANLFRYISTEHNKDYNDLFKLFFGKHNKEEYDINNIHINLDQINIDTTKLENIGDKIIIHQHLLHLFNKLKNKKIASELTRQTIYLFVDAFNTILSEQANKQIIQTCGYIYFSIAWVYHLICNDSKFFVKDDDDNKKNIFLSNYINILSCIVLSSLSVVFNDQDQQNKKYINELYNIINSNFIPHQLIVNSNKKQNDDLKPKSMYEYLKTRTLRDIIVYVNHTPKLNSKQKYFNDAITNTKNSFDSVLNKNKNKEIKTVSIGQLMRGFMHNEPNKVYDTLSIITYDNDFAQNISSYMEDDNRLLEQFCSNIKQNIYLIDRIQSVDVDNMYLIVNNCLVTKILRSKSICVNSHALNCCIFLLNNNGSICICAREKDRHEQTCVDFHYKQACAIIMNLLTEIRNKYNKLLSQNNIQA